MRKLIVFLMIFALLFMSIPSSVFAVFTKVNVGPDTDFDGDINIPSGKSYHINSTALALTDITTAGLISEAMLDGVAGPEDEDILTYEVDTTNFEWHTQAELSLASSGANTDITSILNAALYVGRDTDNRLNWTTDDNLEIWIAGSEHDITGIDTGTGDNDTLVTQGYVDDAIGAVGAIAWDDIGNPDAADEIDFAAHVTELNVEDLRIGDGGDNYVKFADAGAVTFVGTATITLPNDVVTADMIDTVGAGDNLSWDAGDDEMDVDDVFILHAGDVSTGVHDFGGADSFEIPNKDASPANAGELILDTSVADMTNGNLAFYDGTAVRYVVSLAAADIWSDDDFVVAYDAAADKFYMKEDATASGNWVLHLMDVDAADTDYILVSTEGTGASQDKSGVDLANTEPDFGRNITTTGDAGATGVVTITGTLADGTTGQTDAIAIADGATTQGVKAFVTVTNVNISDGLLATKHVEVGIGDLIGLPNAISEEADIYMKTVDGEGVFSEISGNANVANNTLNCATIAQNEDITLYYHN